VIVTVEPLAIDPTVQVTTPEAAAHVPWVELAEASVVVAGSVSATATPVAVLGPLLRTVIV
jgi:hypothetical protein